MSLVDSIISKSVGSAMVSSRSLAGMSPMTLAFAGTSLPQIRCNAEGMVRGSANSASAMSSMTAPIEQMRDFALSNLPGAAAAAHIKNAAMNALNYMDARFQEGLPGVGHTLFDIQNATGEAISSAIGRFSTALSSISASVAAAASSVGNKALVSARQIADAFTTISFTAASQSVSDQILTTNGELVSKIQTQNADVMELPPVTVQGTAQASQGTWSGTEGNPAANNFTDVVYQDIKVYIEGVQVPFESVSISQNIGDLPSAFIQIPPESGLMDIARYYQPKVHIFYTDKNTGGDRLLFWGHIIACNYAKSRQQGMATIAFRCRHKNGLFEQVTLEWSDYVHNVMTGGGDVNPNQVTNNVAAMNSQQSLVSALKGLTGMQEDSKDVISASNDDLVDADPTKLDPRWKDFEKRFYGMPAATMNLWNQLKKTCYLNKGINTIMAKIYIPLIEDGIAFFDRLSGHYYLENIIQNSKKPYCVEPGKQSEPGNESMIPPAFTLPSSTAISQSLAIKTISNSLGFSGEMTTFAQLFRDFYLSVEYEMITLASPAQVPVDPTVLVDPDNPQWSAQTPMMAVETIVKPQIPFYFSPICNVLLPRMYHTVNINQDEEAIPSRITAYHDALPSTPDSIGANYRGPQSIREAIALGIGLASANKADDAISNLEPSLRNTAGFSYNIPGKYEQGKGVRQHKIVMPYWLALLIKGRSQDGGVEETWPEKGSAEYNDLLNLYAAWVDRYGYNVVMDDGVVKKAPQSNPDKLPLNPYSHLAQIHPYERLLFATTDYEYTKQVVQSRNGTIDGLFNPYIVPGYPMDIIDDSPNHPSWHGLCASVTHTITSSSIGTSVGIVGASTYAELSNYYLTPLHPFLQTALKLINVTWDSSSSHASGVGDSSSGASGSEGSSESSSANTTGDTTDSPAPKQDDDSAYYGDVSKAKEVRQSLINNPIAKATADSFYQSVFGVSAAAPDDLYDFSMGQAVPLFRISGMLSTGVADHLPMANGGEGNDFLTGVGNLRLVSRPIEGRKAIESKFGLKFIDLTNENYGAPGSLYQNPILSSDMLLEPGASLFLDYEETTDFVKDAWTSQNGDSSSSSDTAQSSDTTK